MPPKIRAVRKVVKTVIGVDNPEAFAELFESALGQGELDAILPRLWDAVDGRVRQYMNADGENLDADFLKTLHGSRSYYSPPEELEVGTQFLLRGDRYKGFIVEFLGYMPEEDGKPERGRVKILSVPLTSKDFLAGKIFQVPVGALVSKETNTRREII